MRTTLNTNPRNHQRGVTLLPLLALAALLAVWCTIILNRSTDTYRASAVLEWRLQALAAAEGVALLLLDNPARPLEPQTLGAATVTCRPSAPAGDRQTLVPLDVAIKAPGGPPGRAGTRYTAHYRARYVRGGAGWQLLRLEE